MAERTQRSFRQRWLERDEAEATTTTAITTASSNRHLAREGDLAR